MTSPAKTVACAVGLTIHSYSQPKRETLGDICMHAQKPPRNTHNMVHVITCAWYTWGVKSYFVVPYEVPGTATSTKRQAARQPARAAFAGSSATFLGCYVQHRDMDAFIRVYECSKSPLTVQYVCMQLLCIVHALVGGRIPMWRGRGATIVNGVRLPYQTGVTTCNRLTCPSTVPSTAQPTGTHHYSISHSGAPLLYVNIYQDCPWGPSSLSTSHKTDDLNACRRCSTTTARALHKI